MIRKIWQDIGLAFLVFAFAGIAIAQVQNGSITGTVSDPSGAVLPHVDVKALNEASGTHYTAVTTSSGQYTFPSLPIGLYTLSVQATGFKRDVQTHVRVEVGQREAVNFTLTVGSAVQTVEVTASAPALQTQSASPGLVVANRYVQDLPLSGRNWDDLMGLAAGVSMDRYTKSVGLYQFGAVWRPEYSWRRVPAKQFHPGRRG